MAQLLTESSGAPQKVGNRWRAVLITPGKGSSGIYTEDTLRNSGPNAFKKGTHSYVDHPRTEADIRSPKNLIGVLAEDARYEEGVGLVAELDIMPHWKEFVEAVAPHTGLSIYAMGEGNYNDDGDVVVESLVAHTQNSVDLVSYPGRPGSKLVDKLYEAAIAMVAEALPDNYRPATSKDVPEGRACGNCMFFNENKVDQDGKAYCENWDDYVAGGNYCNAWKGKEKASIAMVESPVPGKDKFTTEKEALDRAEELGCEGTHSMDEDGQIIYMPCSTHAIYDKKASVPMGGSNGTVAYETAAVTESNMEEGYSDMELKELSDQLADLPNLVAAAVAEALAPEEETEEKEEVDVAAVAEAMVAADLPEVSRKAVYESLRAGGDLTEAIESQKAFVESVKNHFKEQADAAPRGEENVIVNTSEKAPRLSEILNVKVGA